MSGSGSQQEHWKHTWPSAKVFGNFMCANSEMFKDKVVLELGSGATGVCGLTAAKLGAKKVYLTDHPKLKEALEMLKTNVRNNDVEPICDVTGLDWDDPDSVLDFLSKIEKLDIVIASDVFFDPTTFIGIVRTISEILNKFGNAKFWFAYQERDDNWTIAPLLKKYAGLEASLIRKVETGKETIQIISIIDRSKSNKMFGGVEGGGTGSKLVLIDQTGQKRIWSESHSTNYCLHGVEVVGNHIATWVRKVADENNVKLPLEALGMGLSGAEDETMNAKFVEFMLKFHGDIAKHYHLSSDAVCTVAANFEDQGIVLVAGTGSSCRMLMRNGEVRGVGGWGHAIGDGCSAYWLANRAIRVLFDDDDGLEKSEHSVEKIRELLLQHFKVSDKVGILDFLYHKFEKHTIAQFTKTLSEHSSDPAIARVFFDGGVILGKHVVGVTRHLSEENRREIDIVLVGNVFNSWELLREGFKSAVANHGIHKINLYSPSESPAVGAAAIAAKQLQITIEHAKNKTSKDTISL